MKQFDRVVAAFRPARTDDLGPHVSRAIGQIIEWEAAWIIEGGEYAGQWAMRPVGTARWPFSWVPECDLVPILEG